MRNIAWLLCVSLLLGLFAGCAAGEQAYVPTGHGLADQLPEPGPEDVSDPDQAEKPMQPGPTEKPEKKEFTLAYYEDEGFNPYTCTSFNNRMLFSLLYQSLFFVDREYQAVPILCKSYEASPDFRAHTFEIVDATFSDGTPLTIADVLASLQAARSHSFYRGRFDNVTAIYAIGDEQFRIETYAPYENLPLLLDVPIVKADQLDSDRPLGTGPYSLVETAAGLSLKLRGNWWCEAALPVSSVSIPLEPAKSAAQIRDSFEFDDLGISIADPGAASYAEYRCDYELWETETGIFLYLGCNGSSPVFSNEAVRGALTYAIDRYDLLEKCYHGFGSIAMLPASPESPFYDPGLAGKIDYEPKRLRDAVEEAGMAGQKVVLLVNKSDSVRLQTARLIKQMLEECGLTVELRENSSGPYRETLRTDEWDLYLGQTRLSATMDLSAFFAPYGELSYGDMDDPAAYSMAREALENSGNFYNLHQMILKDGQLVPLLFRTYAVYARRGLADSLEPSRDNVFFYTLGKTLKDVLKADELEE